MNNNLCWLTQTKAFSYLSLLNEPCVQDALDKNLADYSYVNGYTPSQEDVKVHDALSLYDANLEQRPHLARWYNHIKSFSNHEKRAFRSVDSNAPPQSLPVSLFQRIFSNTTEKVE